ncbi:Osmotically-inducible protein OsmY, contains BON domain [Nakamurella panacisegetis]|uniref:Osmotically-inducible protein OsmY, contains BON domain n=1 Tax=Nakamurella panacisegetis TaxID=1090615 RepID=A0A1H0S9Y8_9ACTN|nr:BON domain-containing protein [Nakamurella panacisegetis]SDP38583.1 Osmotically-inducible protein OsmY, contains BON domain [Nakamurella panacisegetis]
MTTSLKASDVALRNSVLQELEWTPSVDAANIGVAVSDGAVTLSGEVGTYPEKAQARKAALRVRGVTAIADEITVRANWAPNDTDIARLAGESLEHAVDVPDGAVKATVHDQVVELTGVVSWEYQRRAAYRAVAFIKGVVAVNNHIRIGAPFHQLTAVEAIKAALARNIHVRPDRIHVSATPKATVHLTGTTSSWFEREQAEKAAWSAAGVLDVDNQLRVEIDETD